MSTVEVACSVNAAKEGGAGAGDEIEATITGTEVPPT